MAGRRIMLAALAGMSAVAFAATPAAAASGTLTLQSPGGTVVLHNPAPGCRTLTTPFTSASNQTDSFVTVYSDAHCQGTSLVLAPGDSYSVGPRLSAQVIS